MFSKSSKWELGLVHYIPKFTISRFVISKFECIVKGGYHQMPQWAEYYVLPLERIELIYSNSCTVNHCGGSSPLSASAITPFGRNSSKHGVCYYFQGFHMYIWDVRRKINPLLLGFRNVFIKNPESWYHRSCLKIAAPPECYQLCSTLKF